MSDDEDIAALVVDNGSGMCKGVYLVEQKARTSDRESVMNFGSLMHHEILHAFIWNASCFNSCCCCCCFHSLVTKWIDTHTPRAVTTSCFFTVLSHDLTHCDFAFLVPCDVQFVICHFTYHLNPITCILSACFCLSVCLSINLFWSICWYSKLNLQPVSLEMMLLDPCFLP